MHANKEAGMVTFSSPLHLYDNLLEREYIDGLFRHLRCILGSQFDEYEFLVWSGLQEPEPHHFPSADRARRVLVYLSDEYGSYPEHLLAEFAAIFKCYLPREESKRLISLPLGYVSGVPKGEVTPINARQYNVFFSGFAQQSRMEFLDVLVHLAGGLKRVVAPSQGNSFSDSILDMSAAFPNSYIQLTRRFAHGLDRSRYGQLLGEAKIALCPCGWKSAETFRHFEAMRAGCIVMSSPLPPTRLYEGSPIIQLKDWRQLESTVRSLLSNPEEMERIQELTLEWWNRVCSEEAVASFMAAHLNALPLFSEPDAGPVGGIM